MGRPSQGIDKALLKAGAEEIKEKGVRGLSVRSVSARAGVSIRMLNYYFGSKDNFTRLVLAINYEKYFEALKKSAAGGGSALTRLRRVVQASAEHMALNRDMGRSLWMDAHAGEPLVLEIMSVHAPTHSGLIIDLIQEAQQAGELRNDIAPSQIFMAAMPGVFMCNLWTEGMLPMSQNLFPEEHRPVVDDAVYTAMRNYDCLIFGFMTEKARATASGAAPERVGKTQPLSAEAYSAADGPESALPESRQSSQGQSPSAYCQPPQTTQQKHQGIPQQVYRG